MNEWLDQFYGSDELRQTLIASLGPLFLAYARDVWQAEGGIGDPPAPFIEGIAAGYAQHHLDSSRAQLQTLLADTSQPLTAIEERLAEWRETRADKVVDDETVRLGNAVTLERMREGGAQRKVWRTRGTDNCPYCSSLDGRTVGIEADFFTPDDSFKPEGALRALTFSHSIGHPPVHRGCDCTIDAG